MINMINLYLEPEHASQRAIIEKAVKGDAEAEKLLTGLAAEAIRECDYLFQILIC